MTTAHGKLIGLRIVGATLEANPKEWLNGEFAAYRNACSSCGLRWNGKVNAGPATALAAVTAALAAAGFRVALEGDETAAAAATARTAALAAAIAAADQEGAALERVKLIEAKAGRPLFGYQRDGVAWLAGRSGGVLGDEQGTGKTIQALAAMRADKPNMVVCPATMRLVWAAEAATWRPDLKVTILTKKDFRYPEVGELVILSYEGLPDAE